MDEPPLPPPPYPPPPWMWQLDDVNPLPPPPYPPPQSLLQSSHPMDYEGDDDPLPPPSHPPPSHLLHPSLPAHHQYPMPPAVFHSSLPPSHNQYPTMPSVPRPITALPSMPRPNLTPPPEKSPLLALLHLGDNMKPTKWLINIAEFLGFIIASNDEDGNEDEMGFSSNLDKYPAVVDESMIFQACKEPHEATCEPVEGFPRSNLRKPSVRTYLQLMQKLFDIRDQLQLLKKQSVSAAVAMEAMNLSKQETEIEYQFKFVQMVAEYPELIMTRLELDSLDCLQWRSKDTKLMLRALRVEGSWTKVELTDPRVERLDSGKRGSSKRFEFVRNGKKHCPRMHIYRLVLFHFKVFPYRPGMVVSHLCECCFCLQAEPDDPHIIWEPSFINCTCRKCHDKGEKKCLCTLKPACIYPAPHPREMAIIRPKLHWR